MNADRKKLAVIPAKAGIALEQMQAIHLDSKK